jgi:hypothetical protein
VPQWDPTLLMSLFRQRLLARLLDRHATSQELVGKLLAWRHPGFSAHLGEPIEAADRQRLEDTAAYLVRNPSTPTAPEGAHRCPESGVPERLPETPRRRSSRSWARLIAKIYQVDPLVCSRCGQRMSVIAFLTDHVSIKRILNHPGLSTPPQDKPPPVRELLRVAEHGEGWGVPADWE